MKTCKHGHEMTQENTYVHNGNRYCRQCGRDRRIAGYVRSRAAAGLPYRPQPQNGNRAHRVVVPKG